MFAQNGRFIHAVYMEIYSTVLNSGLSSLWVLSGRPVFFSFLQGKYIAFGSENKDIFYSDGSIAATTSSSLFQDPFQYFKVTPSSPSSTESRSIRQMRSCLHFRQVWTCTLIQLIPLHQYSFYRLIKAGYLEILHII